MNFLVKIEEAINQFIENLLVKIKGLVPHFIFQIIDFILHIPSHIKSMIAALIPKIRVRLLKVIGYTNHYITIVRGLIIKVVMYLRSEEFKKADKTKLLMIPVHYSKAHPLKAFSHILTFTILMSAGILVIKNSEKIITGTYALRKPASVQTIEEDIYIELKNHMFEVKVGAAGGGGHGGGHGAEAGPHEHEIFLDIKIETANTEEKEFLESMEEMLDDNLEAMELPVSQLPLSPENLKLIEDYMLKSLAEDFKHIGHDHLFTKINLKQNLPSRPVYFRQEERMMSFTEINLQLFLEDTHRNRQVWLDFSVVSSNRNVILYLQDHEVELKDHLTTNVEPVIPQLPVEEEGRLIIKEKIRSEINQFLEKNEIEGKILEVYIDYLMAS